ncbi:hypothetical protein L593_14730 [Salinarchaeum sp. Harcht-Bsk1]|nr:hypothetical protein L593_14730 [Salinarchaeum sp. Harcht-Bsk1]
MSLASSGVIVVVNNLVVFADQQSRVGLHVELSTLMPDVVHLGELDVDVLNFHQLSPDFTLRMFDCVNVHIRFLILHGVYEYLERFTLERPEKIVLRDRTGCVNAVEGNSPLNFPCVDTVLISLAKQKRDDITGLFALSGVNMCLSNSLKFRIE